MWPCFLDDELALGKSPPHEGIVGRRTRREDVVEAAIATALLGQATSSSSTTVGVATSTV
jgi:dsRNA-specific ribonuclease